MEIKEGIEEGVSIDRIKNLRRRKHMKQDEEERSRIGLTKRGVCNEYRKWKYKKE